MIVKMKAIVFAMTMVDEYGCGVKFTFHFFFCDEFILYVSLYFA